MMELLQVVQTVDAVGKLSKNITDYGFLVVIGAVFIILVIILFWITNTRTTKLYSNNNEQFNRLFDKLISDRDGSQQDFQSNVHLLVSNVNEVLTIVKENQEGITERSKKYQTYTGTIKILKNYFGSLKHDLIRETGKIIEKNHIDDTISLCNKISIIVTNIDKKRINDFREFYYGSSCLVVIFPTSINDDLTKTMKDYIQDKERSLDNFCTTLDLLCNNYINEMEQKMQNSFSKYAG